MLRHQVEQVHIEEAHRLATMKDALLVRPPFSPLPLLASLKRLCYSGTTEGPKAIKIGGRNRLTCCSLWQGCQGLAISATQ